jgi:hypothetical protein
VVLEPDGPVVAGEQAHWAGCLSLETSSLGDDGTPLVANNHIEVRWSGVDQDPVGCRVGSYPASGKRQAGCASLWEPQVPELNHWEISPFRLACGLAAGHKAARPGTVLA